MRGSMERTWVFLLAVPLLLPGVNGASSTALKAVATDRATAEGFGKGEFSAWSNNLRAMACAAATVIYGNYYAWAKTCGISPGSTYALAGVFGAVLPELLLRFTSDSEMKAEKDSEKKPELVNDKADEDTTVDASDEDRLEEIEGEAKDVEISGDKPETTTEASQ